MRFCTFVVFINVQLHLKILNNRLLLSSSQIEDDSDFIRDVKNVAVKVQDLQYPYICFFRVF